MQIKGAEASAKPGAINDRSGSIAPYWLCLDVRFATNNDRMADI
jgi:hypothetical protein